MIKILIADDHPIIRQGLRQIISTQPDMLVEGEARDGIEVLELAGKQAWDIVVLDIAMPGRGGLEVLRELRRRHPELPVLVLSMHPEDQYGVRALKAGAAGYLSKESAPDELIKATRMILAGRKYLGPALVQKLASDLANGAQKPLHETLSDREYQVMCMIAAGKKGGEIAAELFVSVKTVNAHRDRILHKLGLKNNAALIHYVLKNQIIEPIAPQD